MALTRITHEPAFVLHRHDWSESSLILEVWTRHHGRCVLVAKGAKRPSSGFRPVLLPLQPLHLNYTLDGDIGTLKTAEWQGGHAMPSGEPLLSGYYLNELLMQLLARGDPHPVLFDRYAVAVMLLADPAARQGDFLQAVLRAWELVLMQEIGLLPELDRVTHTQQTLQPEIRYELVPDAGLRPHQTDSAVPGLPAADWVALAQALHARTPMQALLTLGLDQRDLAQALKLQMRRLLQYHCGGRTLRTRQLLMDLHQL